MKVHSYTKLKEDILNYRVWYLGEEREQRRVLSGQQQGKKTVVSLEGLDNREVAGRYTGKVVCIPTDELPKLSEGEYYWTQLVGLEAVTESGSSLGVVDHLLETGANDVMVIRQDQKEYLVPYVPAVVRKVDLEQGRIELDWEEDG